MLAGLTVVFFLMLFLGVVAQMEREQEMEVGWREYVVKSVV